MTGKKGKGEHDSETILKVPEGTGTAEALVHGSPGWGSSGASLGAVPSPRFHQTHHGLPSETHTLIHLVHFPLDLFKHICISSLSRQHLDQLSLQQKCKRYLMRSGTLSK